MDGLDIATAKWGRDPSEDKALLAALVDKLSTVLPNTSKYLKVGRSFAFLRKSRYVKFIEIGMMDLLFTLNYDAEAGITPSIARIVNSSDFVAEEVSFAKWFEVFAKWADEDPVITIDMREYLKDFIPSE